MSLRVYNTLSRQKEPFATVEPGKVRMYLCGPTVYKPSHIGHMVGPVVFDTVKRFLVYLGYDVNWVVNITDVDDKLIRRAAELGTTVAALSQQMTQDYFDCLRQLNVTGISCFPRATEHIAGMIEMIQGLIDKGYAYPAGGDVYFDVSRDDDYGKLCNRDPEQMEAGARIEVTDRKRNPGDFALWKGAKPGEPQWESPWGPGRPGWHIECSVMSRALLGDTLDIHGGGMDLKFPHHENELAQSESFSGTTFCRCWMHNGLLNFGRSKMAGSVGNVLNIADLLAKHNAETIRYLLLSTHYRSEIGIDADKPDETFHEKHRAIDSFYRFFERYQRVMGKSFYDLQAPATREASVAQRAMTTIGATDWYGHWDSFVELMEDDFNTGGAIGVLYELLNRLNRFADEKKIEQPGANPADIADFQRGAILLRELGQILGLFFAPPAPKSAGNEELLGKLASLLVELHPESKDFVAGLAGSADERLGKLMQQFIDVRAAARKAKNFALADAIRKRLGELGVTLEDRPGATSWRVG
jgi:cysteinyl-tRNA synthetase